MRLNLEDIGRYLEDKDYKVIKLEQIWRHVTGVVKYENERLFFKMASSAEISPRTKNEEVWNKIVNRLWKNKELSFSCPKIFDEGWMGDKYWFVCELVYGKPLKEITAKKTDIGMKDLKKTAKIAKDIIETGDLMILPKDREHLKEMWSKRILQSGQNFVKQTDYKAKNLLNFIEKNQKEILIGASHGDFTPWHIMKSVKEKFILIDGEAAQIGGPRFYDVAYFYHRVYTKLRRPDLANKFLENFEKEYKWDEEEKKCFNLVLSARVIGGYFDAEREELTSFDLNKELEQKILS